MSDLFAQVENILQQVSKRNREQDSGRSRRFGSKFLELKRLKSEVQDATTLISKEDYEREYALTEIPQLKGRVLPLSAEQDQLVDRLLKTPKPGVISQFKTAVVEYKDIQKLLPETWLNDEIINFYMLLLMERSNKSSAFPSIHCFNTFFCSTLRDQGYDKVRRWTKRVDIFSKDLVLIPINRSYHWTLGAVDMNKKQISVYDSLNGDHSHTIKLLFRYLDQEHADKKKAPFDATGWSGVTLTDIPQQENSSDCGVFTCTFAEHLTRDAPLNFSQADMVPIRRRMVFDISQKELSI
ncbi:cysteine proteinase, partial [Hesseltinella vesiculosa]